MESPKDRADDIRQRLVAISDEQRSLAPDDFAAKHRLASESDALRAELAALVEDDAAEASRYWAERAGRKGGHEQDPEALKAMIVSSSDFGTGS